MWRKLSLLSVLYFIQGLPYGFQVLALPVYLRSEGMSLESIGLASALSLPWAFKVVWGPPIDRFGSAKLGRRRSWILPLQVGLMLSCAAAAFIAPGRELTLLVLAVLTMNLFASAMDVAVDGLAVDLLRPEELGYGNIAQVVGYKLGMLTSGGLLVAMSGRIGWQGLFLIMTALVALAFGLTLAFREPRRGGDTPSQAEVPPTLGDEPKTEVPPTLGGVFQTLAQALRVPGTAWLLLFIATYKLGEQMADAMFKPFLYDHGYGAEQIGLWVGTWGMVFSLVGSFMGGALASRIRILYAVGLTALLRAFAVGGEWWLSLVAPTSGKVVGVIAAEQLFGGALTTAMFAYMMSRVDRRIGATHYTLLATVEVVGKLGAGAISGFIAARAGYPFLFGLATFFAFAFLTLLIPLARRQRDESPEAVYPL